MISSVSIQPNDTLYWNKIRNDFPILHQSVNGYPLVYLDNAASSQKPKQVIDCIVHYYMTYNANVHRGVHTLSQKGTEAFEASRKKVQQFIGAASDKEIIFTKGTTNSVNLLAYTFSQQILKPGDEILISALEHHANIVPWQMACERTGAILRVIPMNDDGELLTEQLDHLINDKTRLVSVVHISNALGTVNPVKYIIDKAHSHQIPVMIDGAQAVPHQPVNVQELDCDFYCFSGHKMCAPTGIGVLYAKESWLEKLPPFEGGGEMISEVTFEKTTYNELPFKFEAGTPHIEGVIALGEAIDYLEAIGMDAIYSREMYLHDLAFQQLSDIPGFIPIGKATHKASVLSFLFEGIHPYDLGVILDKQGVAVRTGHHCTQPIMKRFNIPGTVRASFAFYNTEEDVERFIIAVQKAIKMLS